MPDFDSRIVRKEAQEDCGFITANDPFLVLAEKLGPAFAEYRRLWQQASNFELETEFPLQLDFELNYSCNLKCPMCTWSLEAGAGKGKKDWFPFEKFKEIVSHGVTRGLRALDMTFVNEPLIRRDLAEFISYAHSAGVVDIGFNTNGMLLNASVIRRLIASGLTRIQFSIDAFSSESYDKVRTGGNYNKVVKNILNFLELRKEMASDLPLVCVSFVKQRDNDGELENFVAYWESKVDYLLIREYLNPVLPSHGGYEEKSGMFSELRHFTGEFKCTKPWQRMIVRYDGTLLPCCTFQGVYLPMGNIFEQPIETVWKSAQMRDLRRMHKEGRFYDNPICKACALSSTVSQTSWDM